MRARLGRDARGLSAALPHNRGGGRLFEAHAPCFAKMASSTSSTRVFFFERSSHMVL